MYLLNKKEMTNREKYNFDYFTINHYDALVRMAVDNGFTFLTYADELLQPERKEILWRHDVEFSPDIALKMAKIENKYGVKATYFFQIHSEFYNVLEPYFTKILKEIVSLGHEIGLHFDAHYYNIQTQASLDKYIGLDRNYFEQVFDVKLRAFSFHNTNPFILSCEELKYGDLFNVYSEYFKKNFNYCADSTGFWRYEVLDEVLRDPSVHYLQVLTHDAMWSDEVLAPRQRVRKSIQDNAERVKNQYDQVLVEFGAKNIDD